MSNDRSTSTSANTNDIVIVSWPLCFSIRTSSACSSPSPSTERPIVTSQPSRSRLIWLLSVLGSTARRASTWVKESRPISDTSTRVSFTPPDSKPMSSSCIVSVPSSSSKSDDDSKLLMPKTPLSDTLPKYSRPSSRAMSTQLATEERSERSIKFASFGTSISSSTTCWGTSTAECSFATPTVITSTTAMPMYSMLSTISRVALKLGATVSDISRP